MKALPLALAIALTLCSSRAGAWTADKNSHACCPSKNKTPAPEIAACCPDALAPSARPDLPVARALPPIRKAPASPDSSYAPVSTQPARNPSAPLLAHAPARAPPLG